MSGKYKAGVPGELWREPYKVFMGPVVALEPLAPGNDIRNAQQLKLKVQGDTVLIALAEGVQRCFSDGWHWVGEVDNKVVAELPLGDFRELVHRLLAGLED